MLVVSGICHASSNIPNLIAERNVIVINAKTNVIKKINWFLFISVIIFIFCLFRMRIIRLEINKIISEINDEVVGPAKKDIP